MNRPPVQVAIIAVHSPDGAIAIHRLPLPADIGRSPDAQLVLSDPEVSGTHASLDSDATIRDLGSANGLWRENERVDRCDLRCNHTVRLGKTELELICVAGEETAVVSYLDGDRDRVLRLPEVLRHPGTNPIVVRPYNGEYELMFGGTWERVAPDQTIRIAGHSLRIGSQWHAKGEHTDLTFLPNGNTTSASPPALDAFPPAFFRDPVVDLARLKDSRYRVIEREFVALGGGIGSFTWVDALRVHGVPTEAIAVVGFEPVPYARYKRLCENSQIPEHERLRSNSESCPDNLWGFPGYGLREFVSALRNGRLSEAGVLARQLTLEPDRADTYTPRAGDVFSSIDKEAARIGWSGMFHQGRIRSIRKTNDGRYAAAVSPIDGTPGDKFFVVGRFIHIALGYPGVRFLSDLRTYRAKTKDFHRVVNAYEDHRHVYERLEARGGAVVLRGRGIVASRILQRLFEARAAGGPQIRIVHLMRRPKERGQKAGNARRTVENHWEFQPFNWPEACWGGDLSEDLWNASKDRRAELLDAWGGTTTADRSDWKRIVRQGIQEGWYRIAFGTVTHVEQVEGAIRVGYALGDAQHTELTDYILDATGLTADLEMNPVLADLTQTYTIERNVKGGFEITREFELVGLRNQKGRAFAAGVATLGGGYAPVDSFLGLQYAASAIIESLHEYVPRLRPGRSIWQWVHWMRGVAP